MEIQTIPYSEYLKEVPKTGYYILGQQTETEILVYQAFNNQIADYAIKNQRFGGNNYSFSRMTWIKPNFLWMMYRCGWAQKINQERVLGIWITKTGFTKILEESVYSSYKPEIYESKEKWKDELNKKNVRLQWDPDHDIYGEKRERRAIQLGLKNELVTDFNQNMSQKIIDLTEYVEESKSKIDKGKIESLSIPKETIFRTENEDLNNKLNLEKEHHT
ncbi:MAG: DUF4291 domain-containing protein [Saprospiraceae bacterium]